MRLATRLFLILIFSSMLSICFANAEVVQEQGDSVKDELAALEVSLADDADLDQLFREPRLEAVFIDMPKAGDKKYDAMVFLLVQPAMASSRNILPTFYQSVHSASAAKKTILTFNLKRTLFLSKDLEMYSFPSTRR